MKRNQKNLVCLSMAVAVLFSGSIIPQFAHAQQKNVKKVEVSVMQNKAKTQKTSQKQQNKRNISVIENKKIKGIHYPQYLPNNNSITYPGHGKDDAILYPDTRSDNAITYPDARSDNAITYPDTRSDNAITYPDTRSDNAITYPDTRSDNAIVYPDYLVQTEVMPTIIDEEDAYDYLFDVLSRIKKYHLNKNILKVENRKKFPCAGNSEEWYFAYGPKTKGKFIPNKYFAVNENGDIFEFNAKKNRWFILAIACKN